MRRTLAFFKSLRLLIGVVGFLVLAALVTFWWLQQQNVNSLQESINQLEKQIEALPPTVSSKDKIGWEKDRLTLEQQRVSAQNAVYGSLIQALGGAFFFVTAGLSWRNIKATEEKQITERFSKSIEQLGSDKLEVRLGGIYALERISIDSKKDYWTIMEVLTSFIQEQSRSKQYKDTNAAEGDNDSNTKEPKKVAADIQAALTVIRRRDASKDPEHLILDLHFANLRGACLGAYRLEGEYIRANLRGTNFHKTCLAEADLKASILSEASLIEANLSCAILEGAILREANFEKAVLQEANLKGVDLRQAKNLTQEQINEAITDENTKLPDYLKPPQPSQPESPDQKSHKLQE